MPLFERDDFEDFLNGNPVGSPARPNLKAG
jgi:hypothetical protein